MQMNDSNTRRAFKHLLAMLAVSAIAVIVMKDVFLMMVVSIAPLISAGGEFTYLQIWALNAVIAYTPPIAIFWFTFRKHGFGTVAESADVKFKYALLPVFFLSLYALAIISNLFSHTVADVFNHFFGTGELRDPFEGFLPNSGFEWAVMLVFVGIVAATAEEIIYRKLLLQPLRRFGDAQAIVITAVLFGALHGNFTQFLYAVTGGLVLGVVTVRSNSIVPAIILHAANNIFVTVLMFAEDATRLNTGALVIFLAIAGSGATFVLLRTGQFRVGNNCPTDVSLQETAQEQTFTGKQRLRTIVLSPAVIILAVVLIVNMARGS
jgi:membrane protease YdiL (CAAX protease family)